MINVVYATKKGMSQVWDISGKRLPVTKFTVEPNVVVGEVNADIKKDQKNVDSWEKIRIVEIGYGAKKLKNVAKPIRTRLEKLNLKNGVKQVAGVRETASGDALVLGAEVPVADILPVGTIVKVQGTTKGRGFAGAVKRYHFRGGPKTHGQSDRLRAVGSIGNRTTPGRVWLGQRMPGHYGVATQTVQGLIVAHFDATARELWLTGAVPGAFNSIVAITNTGKTRKNFALFQKTPVNQEKSQSSSAPEAELSVSPEVTTNEEKAQG